MTAEVVSHQHRTGLSLLLAAGRRPLGSLRRALPWLRALVQLRRCSQVGSWTRVWGRVRIENLGELVIGERVQVWGVPWATELVALPGGRLEIGDGTFVNAGVSICAARSVSIGARCQIGPRAMVIDSDFHVPGDPLRRPEPRPVVLEDLVWVGAGAMVLKGVRVGRAATIAAGSVVTKDVAPGSVVAGVPARQVGGRPPEEVARWR